MTFLKIMQHEHDFVDC